MAEFIANRIIGDNTDFKDIKTRTDIGTRTTLVGLVINILLAGFKILFGIISNSISILGDGINNLTDTFSSIVSFIGIKISSRSKDKEHPYGHGRYEYISALVVAIGVFLVGFNLLKGSIAELRNPTPVEFSYGVIIVLVVSIIAKFLMYGFYNIIARKIESQTLKAAAVDSIADVAITGVVLASLIISRFINLPVDGIGGLIISIFILYSGFELIREMINNIVGSPPDTEIIEGIEDILKSFSIVKDYHDLMIHSYGHGMAYGTVDVLIEPSTTNIIEVARTFEEIEHRVYDKFNILLTVKMDVGIHNAFEVEFEKILKNFIKTEDSIVSYHDISVVNIDGRLHGAVDLVTDKDRINSLKDEEELIKRAKDYLIFYFGDMDYDIIIDKDF